MNELSSDNRGRRKILAIVVRYFSLTPELQWLFLSSKMAKDMRWHGLDTSNAGLMRHPSDSKAWKEFDSTNNWFVADPRNICLALDTDGFNSQGNIS